MNRQSNENGAVALIFAASLLPMVGILGLGVDAASYLDARERLDSWTEAACERVNSPAMMPLGELERWRSADALFAANAQQLARDGETLALRQAPLGSDRKFSAEYAVRPYFGGLFGVDGYTARSELECPMIAYTPPRPPRMVFVFRDAAGKRMYEIDAEEGMRIIGRGGSAWFPQWLEIKVVRASDRATLMNIRASEHGRTRIRPYDEDVVVEVTSRARNLYSRRNITTKSRPCGFARLCIEDSTDNDYNDSIFEFRTESGGSVFDKRFRGNPYDVS